MGELHGNPNLHYLTSPITYPILVHLVTVLFSRDLSSLHFVATRLFSNNGLKLNAKKYDMDHARKPEIGRKVPYRPV